MPQQKPRRPKGLGSVFQLPDGRWRGSWDTGTYTRSGGRRRITVTAATQKEANARLNRRIREFRTETQSPSTGMSVKVWSEKYLELIGREHRTTSVENTRWALQRILPVIGHIPLGRLSPADIRRVHDSARADRTVHGGELSDASIARIHTVLMAMLRRAISSGVEVHGQTMRVPSPKIRTIPGSRADIPTDEAIQILAAAQSISDMAGAAAHLALHAGLRRAEMLGLTWGDVKLDQNVIIVRRQLVRIPWVHGCGETCGKSTRMCPSRTVRPSPREEHLPGHPYGLGPVKTEAGMREVPITAALGKALRSIRPTAIATPGTRFEFVLHAPGRPGPWTSHYLEGMWHEAQELAGVRHRTGRFYGLHEARHSTVTLLMRAGVPGPVIESIVGHSGSRSTARYIHPATEDSRRALEQLEKALSAPPAGPDGS